MTMLFAASYPQRTAAAVLYGTYASRVRGDDYPWALTLEERREFIQRDAHRLGTESFLDEMLRDLAPSTGGDASVRLWWRRWVRTSASPGAIHTLRLMNGEIDVRHILPAIRVPTLVLHRVGDEDEPPEQGRYLAQHIPGAELVELPGVDHGWWVDPDQIPVEVEPFVRDILNRGEWDTVESDRLLATVMFTDIVGSTAKMAGLGDRGWRDLVQQHHALVRRQLARFSGREIDTAGDGFFASFDGPARAIRCARAINNAVRELGLEVRTGLHTGECELVDGKVGGMAVHIGARVAAQAGPGEVLVSSTVRDIVAGSGIAFVERGITDLKGVGEWRLFAVEGDGTAPT